MSNINTIDPKSINPATNKKWTKKEIAAASAAQAALNTDGQAKPVVENQKQFGTRTCSVALKYPSGMSLVVTRMVDGQEPVMGGGFRVVKLAQQVGEPVHLNGYAAPAGKSAKCMVIGGYAITPNVSLEFMQEWMKQHADSDLVKNNLIFFRETHDRLAGEAEENAGRRSGMEALDPDKLPTPGVTPSDEQKKRMQAAA